MSTNSNTPLFVISNGDDIEYEDDPAVTQVKANLAAVEHIQQERAEQRRLEREEQKAWVEVEHLTKEVKEAERKWRELEEAEVERLMWEKERLEEEKQAEQRRAAALHRLERAAERRRVALVASLPEDGPSRAPPQNPRGPRRGKNGGWGLSSLRRTVCGASHGRRCVCGTWRGIHGVVDYVNNSKNCVGGLRSQRRRGNRGQRTRVKVRGLARGQESG